MDEKDSPEFVLGIHAATGWGSLEFIAFIVEQVGLPTWVPSALILFAMMALAEAFHAASQPDSAIARYRLYIDTPHEDRIDSDQLHLPRAHLRPAELLEQQGDPAGARTHYAIFIDLWKNADPELQPIVSSAQRRLQALLGPG